MQLTLTEPGKIKFDKLGIDGITKDDLSGGMLTPQPGDFNFATQFTTVDGDKYWEYMNHGLNVEGKGPATLYHSTALSNSYDRTVYIVVEVLPWK